jgi:predicted RecB family nuclease
MASRIALETLIWLDRCQRRVWLDAHADPALHVAPARDAIGRTAANRAHAEAVVARTDAVVVEADDWATRLETTNSLVRQGVPLIAWGALEAAAGALTICGEPHLLRRIADTAAPGGWSYQPIDIRLHGEPTRWDRGRLDALRWLVATMLGDRRIPPGELWLGGRDGAPPAVFVRRSDATPAGPKLAERFAAAVGGSTPPVWFDGEHCPFCPWHAACDAAALEQQDIALVAGLRRTHARGLRHAGVANVPQLAERSLAQLADLPDSDRSIARRLKAGAQALLAGRAVPFATESTEATDPVRPITRFPAAVASASALGQPGVVGQSEAADVLFLDVETDPFSRVPWAIGWMTLRGEVTVALVAPAIARRHLRIGGTPVILVRSPAHAWAMAARAARGPVLHWGEAEQLLLARSGSDRPRAVLAPRLLDLHAQVTNTVALPIARQSTRRSAGLKAVAGWLGFGWPEGADHWADGWDAYRAWRAAHRPLRGGAPAALIAPAISYLGADLAALAVVWRWYRLLGEEQGGQSPP